MLLICAQSTICMEIDTTKKDMTLSNQTNATEKIIDQLQNTVLQIIVAPPEAGELLITDLQNRLEKDMIYSDKTSLCQIKPISSIDRYCSELNMNTELTKVCQFVALKIEKNNMVPENTPHSIAAGIIYFVAQVCKLNISKRDVKNVSKISEVTINKCYKKLENMLDVLIPKVIIEKYSK